MVDVGQKASSSRVAVASGRVHLGHEAFSLVKANQMKKGNVVTVAQLAGIRSWLPICLHFTKDAAQVLLASVVSWAFSRLLLFTQGSWERSRRAC